MTSRQAIGRQRATGTPGTASPTTARAPAVGLAQRNDNARVSSSMPPNPAPANKAPSSSGDIMKRPISTVSSKPAAVEHLAVEPEGVQRDAGQPHGGGHPSAGTQDPSHLGRRRGTVGEELQALLAQHDVEGPRGEVELGGRAHHRLDRSGLVVPDHLGQHVLADVAGHDATLGTRGPGRRPGHRARPRGHVEHHLPGATPAKPTSSSAHGSKMTGSSEAR